MPASHGSGFCPVPHTTRDQVGSRLGVSWAVFCDFVGAAHQACPHTRWGLGAGVRGVWIPNPTPLSLQTENHHIHPPPYQPTTSPPPRHPTTPAKGISGRVCLFLQPPKVILGHILGNQHCHRLNKRFNGVCYNFHSTLHVLLTNN